MSRRDSFIKSNFNSTFNLFDLLTICTFLLGGSIYLKDYLHWGVGWIGQAEYGDAEFWWNGAVEIANGFFIDHNGYRAGYFILTGLILPLTGLLFKQFYPFFLIGFLSTCSFFYIALSQLLGRWVSACVVGMLIFNPYTAEWVATTTTDSTGLILNLAALSCLLYGVNKNLDKKWLIAFGFFFALGTITRPLITPFIGLVIAGIIVFSQESFKKRILVSLLIAIAFIIPTFLWMSVEKILINQWSLSSNDASAFYAASDPNIQVWSADMYLPIQKLAAKTYKVHFGDVDLRMMNHMYWQQTIENYIKYPQYHLSRIGPHIWEIARFSPKSCVHGSEAIRLFLFYCILIGLSSYFIFEKKWFRAAIVIFMLYEFFNYPMILPFLIIAGAIMGLIDGVLRRRLGILFLSSYWLTGVFVLYLVGGTWGKPSFSDLFALNALGYRVGSQFFFIGDVLAAYFILNLVSYKFKANKNPISLKLFQLVNNTLFKPSKFAQITIVGYFSIFLITLISSYLIGAVIVSERAYALRHTANKPFPTLMPIGEIYKNKTGKNITNNGVPNIPYGKIVKGVIENLKTNQDLLFTGTVSPFVWNLKGQERSQLKVFPEDKMQPQSPDYSAFYLDIPKQVSIDEWSGRRGAFIIRKFEDIHTKSYEPYYLTSPAVRAFFPLSKDGKRFELDKAIWFPLVKNATQLDSSGEFKIENCKVEWSVTSGNQPYKRRFILNGENNKDNFKIILNTKKMIDPKQLVFSYLYQPNSNSTLGSIQTTITGIKDNKAKILFESKSVSNKEALNNINVTIPSNIQKIVISFNNVKSGEKVEIFEFNVIAKDFT